MSTLRLGVNIDHVATLRQVRYVGMLDSANAEPDLVAAAVTCERAGAHSITVHLREDRRHIQDRDVERLRANVITKLNLEMGNTKEILDVALRILPEDVCLVPESRKELTTEGGLDVVGGRKNLERTVQRLQASGIRVSLFIDPEGPQIDAAAEIGAEAVELHTGAFANAEGAERVAEFKRLGDATRHALSRKLQVNAGHGINYVNIAEIRGIHGLSELNIGHSIVSHALFVGLENAVREMLALMQGTGA